MTRPNPLTAVATKRRTPGSSGSNRSNPEDLLNKIWDCVRTNNGILVLLEMLNIKTPITEADSLRALACKALVGLARSEPAKQIMSKLPIFTNGQLQQLVREPLLQDKRAEHVKFQEAAFQLLQLVSVPGNSSGRTGPGGGDNSSSYSLEMLHRASVVAQTKIRFPKKQLLQLVQGYLQSQGLSETASVLQREANLALMKTPNKKSLLHHHRESSNRTPTPRTPLTTPSLDSVPPSTPSTSGTGTIHLRVHRRNRNVESASSNEISSSFASPSAAAVASPRSLMKVPPDPAATRLPFESQSVSDVSLVSIVCDYLSGQHSLCKNPMTTCPEFDLFVPHKCPEPRPRNSAPWNFATRFSRRSLRPPFGGPDGIKLDRKLLFSRFAPTRTLRIAQNEDDAYETLTTFSSCAFMPDDSYLLAGTATGEMKMFNVATGVEESTYTCHDSPVYHMQPSKDCKLLLTSNLWRVPYSSLWSMGEFFETKLTFRDEEYVEFSKSTQDMVIGTRNETAIVYDLNAGKKIREFVPTVSNGYLRNRATFDPTDDLVLNDGVLFDMRASKEIHKLDKLNLHLSGVFNPNGLEIVSNCEVWDIRTFRLLKTVPGLDRRQIHFTNGGGNVFYAVGLETEDGDEGDRYESSFKTFDASDYSNVTTFETRRGVVGLCSSFNDLSLAVVENSLSPGGLGHAHEESVIRIYDVGRTREDEEDGIDEEDDPEAEDEEDDDDDDDDESDEFFDLLGGSSEDDDGDDEDEEDDDDEEDEGDEEMGDDEEQQMSNDDDANDNDSWEDIDDSD